MIQCRHAEGPITYYWTRVSGPNVTLYGYDTATPYFVASATGAHYTVEFELRVTDDVGLTATDRVAVEVLDPTADEDGDTLPQKRKKGVRPY